jgi:hypothetical protein
MMLSLPTFVPYHAISIEIERESETDIFQGPEAWAVSDMFAQRIIEAMN